MTSPSRVGSALRTTDVPSLSTDGSARPLIARELGSLEPSTQEPSTVMPIGTTSYRSGSRLLRTLPAETQDTECSLLRPPKITATRVRLLFTRQTVPPNRLRHAIGPVDNLPTGRQSTEGALYIR